MASTSSSFMPSSRVSKNTIRLFLPIPVKYALPCDERLEPSITNTPSLLNPVRVRRLSIFAFNSWLSSGLNLLKIGAIKLGYAQNIISEKVVKSSQTYSHQYSPIAPIKYKIAYISGSPNTRVRITSLAKSVINVELVILLKPNFCSTTKVR